MTGARSGPGARTDPSPEGERGDWVELPQKGIWIRRHWDIRETFFDPTIAPPPCGVDALVNGRCTISTDQALALTFLTIGEGPLRH